MSHGLCRAVGAFLWCTHKGAHFLAPQRWTSFNCAFGLPNTSLAHPTPFSRANSDGTCLSGGSSALPVVKLQSHEWCCQRSEILEGGREGQDAFVLCSLFLHLVLIAVPVHVFVSCSCWKVHVSRV